ncbi:MAG: acyl-CoA dehydrogenase family protein [Mycobacteriales bacterium]|nr:MAG: acyl-CoA dehydrogenase [Pseudonocardiales bacterium]
MSEERAEIRAIATELAPIAAAGEPGRVNRPLVRALGAIGLLRQVFPDDAEPRAATLCLLREGLAYGCTEAETALALQGLGGFPIRRHGSQTLVRRWIPAIAAGDVVAAFALSEPDAGSDAAALKLRAASSAHGWTLHGEKTWISNAPDADIYSVFARTGDDSGARGVTAFAVPADRAGLSGERIDMVAPHAIGRLVFDGVEVGPDDLLGAVGHGFGVAMGTLTLFRPSVGAFAIGMAAAALDAAVGHAAKREAFGAPLARLQAVSHRLADLTARIEAARLLVYSAAAAYDDDAPDAIIRAAMAKLLATELAQEAVDAAIQVHGAVALQRGHLLEHLYREVRAPRIYEGASEVQREIIARGLFA